MKRLIIIFCLSPLLLYAADDISFVGGCKIKNVSILTNTKSILTIKTTEDRIISFENPSILEITTLPMDIDANSTLDGYNCLRIDPIYQTWEDKHQESFVDKSYYTYPNLYLLPVSFIAFALTYDAIDNIIDINDAISGIDKLNNEIGGSFSTAELESQRTKYYILGAIYLIAGVVNTKFAFERVKIYPKNDGIQLSYIF